MKTIGYRRVSGAIGLTSNETGARGAWVEKRRALWEQLEKRGYYVESLSRYSKATQAEIGQPIRSVADYDVLMLEFGGNNAVFNGKDWDETIEIVHAHSGPVYFVCDDPDLTFLWDKLPNEDWSRWTILVNAVNTDVAREILKVPAAARVVDYPAHTGIKTNVYAGPGNGRCVYLGRPNGRLRQLGPFLHELTIAGKPAEWAKVDVEDVIEQPSQSQRRQFYAQFSAAFAGFDGKHARSGWRTGRAFHALFSGVPVIVPDASNTGLRWAYNAAEGGIRVLLDLDDDARRELWWDQVETVWADEPDWQVIGL